MEDRVQFEIADRWNMKLAVSWQTYNIWISYKWLAHCSDNRDIRVKPFWPWSIRRLLFTAARDFHSLFQPAINQTSSHRPDFFRLVNGETGSWSIAPNIANYSKRFVRFKSSDLKTVENNWCEVIKQAI